MFRRNLTAKKTIAIFALLLVSTVCGWAATRYYSVSGIVKMGKGGQKVIAERPEGIAYFEVVPGALDDYMTEQGINQVQLWCDLEATYHKVAGVAIFDRLDFTFGPSGAYFNPPLRLIVQGDWVTWNPEFNLYDENGEAMEHTVSLSGDSVVIEIPHFSSYIYDHY